MEEPSSLAVIVGLPSKGLHTNGYSLARKLFFETLRYQPDTFVDAMGQTVAEALLQTHLSYLTALGPLLDSGLIKGLAHITGGGLMENIPRILPAETAVEIKRGSWMVIVCAAGDAAQIQDTLKPSYEIGRVTHGDRNVSLI
jgi:phosphoribosylformylglycinamidine cyclo-ligase